MLVIGQCNRVINIPCLCKWKEGVAVHAIVSHFAPLTVVFFLDEKVQRMPSQCNHPILLITWIITA